jgi:hypothetical protein
MKEGLFQLEDAQIALFRKVDENESIDIEQFLNVNLKRVKQNIINAFNQKKIFDQENSKSQKHNSQNGAFGSLSLSKSTLIKHKSEKPSPFDGFAQTGDCMWLTQPNPGNDRSEFFLQEFKEFLNIPENSTIFSACVWHIIFDVNYLNAADKVSAEDLSFIQTLDQRMLSVISDTYLNLFSQLRANFKKVMNKLYFDVVAQAVFYSLFYAFPKSRHIFNQEFRIYVFNIISKLFKGCAVSPSSVFYKNWNFIDDWYLDLGAGNVLKNSENGNLTSQSFSNDYQQSQNFRSAQKTIGVHPLLSHARKSRQLQKFPVQEFPEALAHEFHAVLLGDPRHQQERSDRQSALQGSLRAHHRLQQQNEKGLLRKQPSKGNEQNQDRHNCPLQKTRQKTQGGN